MISRIIFLLVGLVLGGSCITPMEIDYSSQRRLIVDAVLTDQDKIQEIKLSQMVPWGAVPNYNQIQTMRVSVLDESQQEYPYAYYRDGIFRGPAGFKGEHGRQYKLRIVANEDVYESPYQLLQSAPTIDTLIYKTEGLTVGLQATFDDIPNHESYYRWRYRNTYQVFSPKAPTNLQTCWMSLADVNFLNISDDKLFKNETARNYEVVRFDADRKFEYGYMAEVQMFTLTEEVYTYWDQIEFQLNNTGSLFETVNFDIQGNIRSLSTDEYLLGVFQVSGVSEKRVFVDAFISRFGDMECVPDSRGVFSLICRSCLNMGATATTTKPANWPN
jgi:hypothetical protein